MSEKEFQNGFAIIPTHILCDRDLPCNAKLLFGIITSLTRSGNICYASNAHFADKLGQHEKSISRLLSILEKAEFITMVRSNKSGYGRRIYPNMGNNSVTPSPQNCYHGRNNSVTTHIEEEKRSIKREVESVTHTREDGNDKAPADLATELMKEQTQTMERAQMAAIRSSLDFKKEVLTCILYYQSNGLANIPLNQLARKVELWMARGGDFVGGKTKKQDDYIPPSKRG